MPFKTIRDLLDQLRDFHHNLGLWYEGHAALVTSPKTKMMMEYLGRHTAKLERLLEIYEQDQNNKLLSTWVQFPMDLVQTKRLASVIFTPDMDENAVVDIAMSFHERLIEFYMYISEHTSSSEVRDLFNNLTEIETEEGRKAATCAWDM